ncbi:MAG: hypothetical protein KAI24_21345, partial [Planctomycetes bacterium]|nr:hypothetical protein [Planctomycetota bacterium]
QCDLFVWTTTDAQLTAARAAVGDRAQPYEQRPDAVAPRPDREQQYYLHKSPLRFVPMTRAQATRANAAMRGGGEQWRRYLSPRQLDWLRLVRAAPKQEWPVAQGAPMPAAVTAFTRAASKSRQR